ncbi:MAG: DNA-processing protein DprA [Candidatus Saccharimonadales bacterium]
MHKINKTTPDESEFLQITKNIANYPKRLWLLGKLPQTRIPTIAIVGTRRPSPYGKEIGYRLAYELASRGVVVVSGLALGIDAIAHQAALDAGGTTIAVLPSSVTEIYPASHRKLAQRIMESGGALLSEYEPGTTTYPANFIARNRIVSGISDGLLVVEAAAKSGTMHTAGFALEQGKPVMAVPGNITNPMSEGCNNLIKMGARPITDVSDILHELGLTEPKNQATLPIGNTAEEQAILTLIASGTRDGIELQVQSKLTPAAFSQTLTMLEVTGKIRALGGNQWTLR